MSPTFDIFAWFSEPPLARERRETRQLWDGTEALWRASPLADERWVQLVTGIVSRVEARHNLPLARPLAVECCLAIDGLLRGEELIALEADWPLIEGDAAVALGIRKMLMRRRRWSANFEQMFGIFRRQVEDGFAALLDALPESCFEPWAEDEGAFGVPLVELLERPAEVIEQLVLIAYSDDALQYEVFWKLRERLITNILVASGFRPDDDPHALVDRLVMPSRLKGKSAAELARIYLAGTPLEALLEFPVPFSIPAEARFEHCHIVGGTGHGKTQLMQRMIHADLVSALASKQSVVVIDSQGDLINKLIRLRLFDPERTESLAGRLVLIDPADVEFPAALNLFDAHLSRLQAYTAVDRERVLNGVIELYEIFFGAMLGAELTQKQGVIFRYLARLMITIPGATIHTLMQLMEDGKPFREHMDALEGSARHFFQTEFFHPSFAATKKQILKRLWGVLSTPAFERMFAQPTNKLDLFEALQAGKIILVSTAKDLLKGDGSALFGRFFIAMLAQAALERSTVRPEERTPTYVYIDEAQEYFDDSIETILNQARKYRVGLTLAHQTLDQLSPRLRSAILANTSLKCVGGVSSKDARALADELRTSADFVESMRRRGERSEFAVWLKHHTAHAVRMSVPLGFIERQPLLSEEGFEALLDQNRARYSGTLADIAPFVVRAAEPEPAPPVPTLAPASGPAEDPDQIPAPPPLPAEGRVPSPPVSRPPAPDVRQSGKGGPQHRYVQHLIKGLAEDRGFRAVIEAPVVGGQIDVALYRDTLAIACEISLTTSPAHEGENLAKCLRAGFAQVLAIAPDARRLRTIEAEAKARLSQDELARVSFLAPEAVADALDALALPPPEENVVRGYKVRVSRTAPGAAEAKDRRAAVARVIAQSLRGLPKEQ